MNAGLGKGASWYMFDWRGAGKSTAPSGPVRFSDLVDDVEAVALAIGEPFDVSAVADGCGLALALAARHPEMVRRMLLVAPQGEEALRQERASGGQSLADANPVFMLAMYLMWVHPGTDPDETHQIAAEARLSKPRNVVRAHREAALDVDLVGLASNVIAPALLISTGDQLRDAFAIAAVMPFARVGDWTEIGDGTINGTAWREAWDEMIPPGGLGTPAAAGAGSVHSLSPREAEILELVCLGLSNAEIGERLVIAPSTAKRHVTNIFGKMGVSNRPQAIALAHDLGLIPAVEARRSP